MMSSVLSRSCSLQRPAYSGSWRAALGVSQLDLRGAHGPDVTVVGTNKEAWSLGTALYAKSAALWTQINRFTVKQAG